MAPPAKFGKVPTSTSAESGYTHALAKNVLLTLIILWDLGHDAVPFTNDSSMLPTTESDPSEVRTSSATPELLQSVTSRLDSLSFTLYTALVEGKPTLFLTAAWGDGNGGNLRAHSARRRYPLTPLFHSYSDVNIAVASRSRQLFRMLT